MQQITDTTTRVYFGNDDPVKVKETLAETLMLTALFGCYNRQCLRRARTV
jgi:hypothetical protein